MADTGWWAEDIGDGSWVPTIQLGSVLCLSLPAWFKTEAECLEFIRANLVGAGELPPEP